jgi:hypothetical protein
MASKFDQCLFHNWLKVATNGKKTEIINRKAHLDLLFYQDNSEL